ncbi:MAG: phenylacetate-CoA oxygenase subunit PaaI [Gemmatimonadetes bacterium]|nr:phenylacetate-CoA oxygenase subunit PaaI [Gemmatimonadota bacterium]
MPAPAPTIELSPAARTATRDLILVLADSKRLLGMRYAEWILGAPELEASIACAAMAQDEWGHARLLYALLKDLGDDVDRLEHGREPAEYCSLEALDLPPQDWPDLVVLNALADAALTTQCEALLGSAYAPLAQRVEKLLEEERFHAAHGAAWLRRLARAGESARGTLALPLTAALPALLRWLGPDSPRAAALREAGVVNATGSALRARYLERIAPLLAELGDAAPPRAPAAPDFAGFDEARRRVSTHGPDAATVARIRGDKNRVFLMD